MNLGALAGKQSGRDLPLFPTPSQINAKGLLREVQAAEEGLEAGVGGRSSRRHIRNKKVRY